MSYFEEWIKWLKQRENRDFNNLKEISLKIEKLKEKRRLIKIIITDSELLCKK